MQATAKTTLASLVEDHLTSLVRETICVQRHAKRARFHQTSEDDGIIRRRLHAEDINLALQWRGSERLYATGTVLPTTNDSKKKVDLNAYLKSEMQDRPPSEIGLTMHWLAVDGTQPLIPQNPSLVDAVVHRVEDEEDQLSQYQGHQQGVRVRQLLPRLLSEELQLYFTRITLALEKGGATPNDRQQQDDALARVARDAGLQELVPFFIQYLAKQLHLHVGHPEHCRTLIRLTRSLLINLHIHLELHVSMLIVYIYYHLSDDL
jgi:transcription initiation factor TFIID subunit 6